VTSSITQTAPLPSAGLARPTPQRFVVLDGLRGVGAIAVILDHVPQEMVNGFLPGRALSVDFFFVLSGFVLAHAYGTRLSTTMSALEFLRLRVIRFYPLYLLGFLIALPVTFYWALTGRTSMQNVASSVFFGVLFLPKPPLRGGWGSSFYPLNGPAWSLLFELAANLVYALVAKHLTVRRLARMLPLLAILLVATLFNHATLLGPGYFWAHTDAGFARVMYGFFAGVLIYMLRDRWRAPALPAWLSIVIFVGIVGVPATGLWRPAYDSFASVVLMPLLVLFSTNSTAHGTSARVFSTLGLMSYAVYMLHVPLLGVQTFVLDHYGVQFPGVVFILLLILVAGVVALLADRFYDTPVRRWLMARFANSTSRAARIAA
jgi:peptidoglycan/LPS O-acetylase OafA/YrhL